jgi:hypothetical protein
MASHRKHIIMYSNDARVVVREFHKPSNLYIRASKRQMVRRRAFWMNAAGIIIQRDTNTNELQHLVTDYYALVLFRSNLTPLPMLQNEISTEKAMYLRMMGWFRNHEFVSSELSTAH